MYTLFRKESIFVENYFIKFQNMEFKDTPAEFLRGLKDRAESAGMSLTDVADKIDVSSAALYRWLEKTPMSIVTLFKFVAAVEAAEAAAAEQWRAESCDGVPGLRLYRLGLRTQMYVTPEPSSERPEFCTPQQWAKLQSIWDEPF
jgi:transcriptional regulator with XRE-family HTH domain